MTLTWSNEPMAEEPRSPFAPVGLADSEDPHALELGHELVPPLGGIGQLTGESTDQTAVRQAIAAGIRDVNELTNRAFFALHPERGGRALSPSEPGFAALGAEWKTLRDTVVRPMLSVAAPAPAAPATAELWVPGAERIASRLSGGSYLAGPWRFVFHTIEGEPSADAFRRLAAGHTSPPHLWAMPSADLLLQTIPLNRSAYALARPSSTQTNRLQAVQVELWGFAAKMASAPHATLNWLADRVLAPVARMVPINLDNVRPPGGEYCYGTASPCRMSPEEWARFDGVCGHKDVPTNSHWDPGGLNMAAIAARAKTQAGGSYRTREDESWYQDEVPIEEAGMGEALGYEAEIDSGPGAAGPVREHELVLEEGWFEDPAQAPAGEAEGEQWGWFPGDAIAAFLRKPTVGFELDVHYGLMKEVLLAAGLAMPADGAILSDHTWAADGFLVKLDGPRLEINTRPFETTAAGKAELQKTIDRIKEFADDLAERCANAPRETVSGCTGSARPFTHPRFPAVRIVKLPFKKAFKDDDCRVWAAPQATLTIPLSKVRTLVQRINESEGKGPGKALSGAAPRARMGLRSDALYRAAAEVKRARRTLTFSDDVEGLLILLASYLWTSELTYKFPRPGVPAKLGEDYEPFGKAYLPINVKTPFDQVFSKLLSAADQQVFRNLFADGAARVNLFRLARPSGATLADGNRKFLPTGPMDGGRPTVHDNQAVPPPAGVGVVPTWNDLVTHTVDPTHLGLGNRLLVGLSKPIDVSTTQPRVALELRRIGWASVYSDQWPKFMTSMLDLTEELSR
jgi:hypothetical protein